MNAYDMDCRRAEQLFSDHCEQTLPEPLRLDLVAHLAVCEECRALHTAFFEVVRDLQALPAPSLPGTLIERVHALRTQPPRRRRAASQARLLLLTAAIVAFAVGIWTIRDVFTPRGFTRAWNRAASASANLAEKKDRFVENLRLLKVVVWAAFEGRVERMNEELNGSAQLPADDDEEPEATPSPAPSASPAQINRSLTAKPS
ncbi:MAG: hypothetical protein MUF51_03545 [Vicinamibacteria bacterium]|nr:hypothetical protein [Vicinamibacteria bacterium]